MPVPRGANPRANGDIALGASYCDEYSGLGCRQGTPAADVGQDESGLWCRKYSEGVRVPAGEIPDGHIPKHGLPALTDAGDLAYWDSLKSGLLQAVGIGGGLHGNAFA